MSLAQLVKGNPALANVTIMTEQKEKQSKVIVKIQKEDLELELESGSKKNQKNKVGIHKSLQQTADDSNLQSVLQNISKRESNCTDKNGENYSPETKRDGSMSSRQAEGELDAMYAQGTSMISPTDVHRNVNLDIPIQA